MLFITTIPRGHVDSNWHLLFTDTVARTYSHEHISVLLFSLVIEYTLFILRLYFNHAIVLKCYILPLVSLTLTFLLIVHVYMLIYYYVLTVSCPEREVNNINEYTLRCSSYMYQVVKIIMRISWSVIPIVSYGQCGNFELTNVVVNVRVYV